MIAWQCKPAKRFLTINRKVVQNQQIGSWVYRYNFADFTRVRYKLSPIELPVMIYWMWSLDMLARIERCGVGLDAISQRSTQNFEEWSRKCHANHILARTSNYNCNYNSRKLHFPSRCLTKPTDLVFYMTTNHHDFILTSHQTLFKRTFIS